MPTLWKNADKLAEVFIATLLPYKEHIKSITSDNETEFSRHQFIAKKIKC